MPRRGWIVLALIGLTGCASAPTATSPTTTTATSPTTTTTSPVAAPDSTMPSGSGPTAAGARLPPAAGRFSYQIGGPYAVPAGVRIVDRDRTAAAAPGTYSICYVNAFQAQPDALDWWQHNHPELLLHHDGRLVIDEQWQEPLLDIAKPNQLMMVVGGWIDGCARSGYQAVEADNLDSYTRSDGELTRDQALAFGRLLAIRAHHDQLALAQKNAAELSAAARAAGFDFAVAEECQVFAECDQYTNVYGDELIEIEYSDQDSTFFDQACAARGRSVSVVRRDRDVTPAGEPAHVEQWC